jgi:hypothetical protein
MDEVLIRRAVKEIDDRIDRYGVLTITVRQMDVEHPILPKDL